MACSGCVFAGPEGTLTCRVWISVSLKGLLEGPVGKVRCWGGRDCGARIGYWSVGPGGTVSETLMGSGSSIEIIRSWLECQWKSKMKTQRLNFLKTICAAQSDLLYA